MKMKKYPIYKVDVKWTYEDDKPCSCQKENSKKPKCWSCRYLSNNRRRNRTGWDKMYKEEKTNKEIRKEILEWWKKYSKKVKNPSEPEITIKFLWNETWCIDWFSHWTFDEGQSDSEVMLSFASFVDRMNSYNQSRLKEEKEYCLMGAENSWRWHGETDDGKENTEPPCRCKYCKEQGKIRIGH